MIQKNSVNLFDKKIVYLFAVILLIDRWINAFHFQHQCFVEFIAAFGIALLNYIGMQFMNRTMLHKKLDEFLSAYLMWNGIRVLVFLMMFFIILLLLPIEQVPFITYAFVFYFSFMVYEILNLHNRSITVGV